MIGEHKPLCPQPCLRIRNCLISLKVPVTCIEEDGSGDGREAVVIVNILIRTSRRCPFMLHFPSRCDSWHTRESSLKLQHLVWIPSPKMVVDPWFSGDALALGNSGLSQGSWKTQTHKQVQVFQEQRINPPDTPGTYGFEAFHLSEFRN